MYKRNTVQRKAILDVVNALKNHPTADEVYDEVVRQFPSVSRATVYRGLKELSEAGEIKHIETPDGADHFDHCLKKHYHVKCVECERVFDVDLPYKADLVSEIGDDQGFVFLGHDIVFKGICPDCQRKQI